MFKFWATAILLLQRLRHFCNSHQTCVPGSNFSSSLLMLTAYFSFGSRHPGRCEVISHVVLICISLMVSDIEHFFPHTPVVICTSSLEKCPAKPFAHLRDVLFTWKHRVVDALSVFSKINPLSDVRCLQRAPCLAGCLHQASCSLCCERVSSWLDVLVTALCFAHLRCYRVHEIITKIILRQRVSPRVFFYEFYTLGAYFLSL